MCHTTGNGTITSSLSATAKKNNLCVVGLVGEVHCDNFVLSCISSVAQAEEKQYICSSLLNVLPNINASLNHSAAHQQQEHYYIF